MPPWRLPRAIPRRLFELPDDWVHRLLFVSKTSWYHGKAVPLLGLSVALLELIQRVVQRVGFPRFLHHTQDGAGLGVALDFNFFGFNGSGCLGDNIERIGSRGSGCVSARGFWVVETEQCNCFLSTAGGVIKACGETEAAVVLGEGFLLIPVRRALAKAFQSYVVLADQCFAMIGFCRIFFLEGPFCRFFGILDLFFFFWSSRPMLTVLE